MNSLAQQFITDDAVNRYARSIDPAGNEDCEDQLSALSGAELFDDPVRDQTMAACCESGLWLLHNFLHESHEISQSIHTAEGSWWHAIMHRTEGDFSNTKYWYRRVGEHAAFDDVHPGFNPFTFVDQCQREYGKGQLPDETQAIAVAEWRALFDFCYRNAT